MVYDKSRNSWISTKIGKFVDKVLAKYSRYVVKDDNTEILHSCTISDEYYTPSFDPKTLAVKLSKIRAFIRVKAPEKLYRVKLKSGRCVTVTGAHNFYVLRNSQIQLLKTTKIRIGDCLPIPLQIPLASNQMTLSSKISYERILGEILHPTKLVLFLRRYYNEHGNVTDCEIETVTNSVDFASDLMYALAFLGIHASIRFDENSSRYYVTVRSSENLQRFNELVGFGKPEKQRALEEILNANLVSDIKKHAKRASSLLWDEVIEVEKIESKSDENIYDFSTEHETFLAGVGGVYVHNTTLLVNMIVQDMQAGHGLCFIDPKVDAIEDVLMRVPEHRIEDVILTDPVNYDKVVGLNFLELPRKNLSDFQLNAIKKVIVSNLVALMRQQTRYWNERFGRIFEAVVRAVLDYNEKVPEEEQLTFFDLYVRTLCLFDLKLLL